jgi:GNAT superfamily N-acetyltransferase
VNLSWPSRIPAPSSCRSCEPRPWHSCHTRTCCSGQLNQKMQLPVARVHVRSWQAAYRQLLPDDYLDQLRPEDRAETYDFATLDPRKPQAIVATEEGLIRGFATTAPSRDPDLPGHGELCALYVDPEQWGRGMGVALVSAARANLFGLGFRNAFLWVLAGNVRAQHFYRIDQWASDGLRRTDSVWEIAVNELRYQRGL